MDNISSNLECGLLTSIGMVAVCIILCFNWALSLTSMRINADNLPVSEMYTAYICSSVVGLATLACMTLYIALFICVCFKFNQSN